MPADDPYTGPFYAQLCIVRHIGRRVLETPGLQRHAVVSCAGIGTSPRGRARVEPQQHNVEPGMFRQSRRPQPRDAG